MSDGTAAEHTFDLFAVPNTFNIVRPQPISASRPTACAEATAATGSHLSCSVEPTATMGTAASSRPQLRLRGAPSGAALSRGAEFLLKACTTILGQLGYGQRD
jgi:hypothetical protein